MIVRDWQEGGPCAKENVTLDEKDPPLGTILPAFILFEGLLGRRGNLSHSQSSPDSSLSFYDRKHYDLFCLCQSLCRRRTVKEAITMVL
jgi:hypothetical protein